MKEFPTHKDHLNKTFLEELNYKLWSTKSTRFQASLRLLKKDNLSNRAIGFLSAYLIIFGLISVYNISGSEKINADVVAFATTTVSILVLAFSQMEAAQDYKVRALSHQKCALEVSKIYNELRILKTLKSSTETEEVNTAENLSRRYEEILENFHNHDSIDYQIFKADNHEYFELTRWDIIKIRSSYYLQTKLLYHLLIILPPLVFALFTR